MGTDKRGEHRRKRCGHVEPRPPIISLDQPGRLRAAHVMSLLGISHSTLYAGMKKGRYPKADGYDGVIPFWNTATIRQLLQSRESTSANANQR